MELQTENGKKKAPLSTGLKWLRLVCMAVAFGIIAGGVMVGMNYLGGRIASEEESIPQTSTVKVTAKAEDSDAVVAVARELSWLDSYQPKYLLMQLPILVVGIICYTAFLSLAYRISVKYFDKVDL